LFFCHSREDGNLFFYFFFFSSALAALGMAGTKRKLCGYFRHSRVGGNLDINKKHSFLLVSFSRVYATLEGRLLSSWRKYPKPWPATAGLFNGKIIFLFKGANSVAKATSNMPHTAMILLISVRPSVEGPLEDKNT